MTIIGRKRVQIFSCIALLFLCISSYAFAGDRFVARSLDNAPVPPYDYSRANRLPLTGYFFKTFDIQGEKRTARIYIAPDAPIRAYFTIIAVPDGVESDEFVLKSGWKALADQNNEGLFILEPGENGWQTPDKEQSYLQSAIGFYRNNDYFSIFGENYLVGYGKGGSALEMWAANNPLLVCSQVYVETSSHEAAFYAQFAKRKFDGLSSGYKKIEIPEHLKIAYNEVPVPTWYINSDLTSVKTGIEYWKSVNDCKDADRFSKASYLYGSLVFPQSKDSNAWQTDYAGPISKVAVLERLVNPWDKELSSTIYKFLTEFVRYDVTSAYGNQLGLRVPIGQRYTMMVNGFIREYMVYVPDSAYKLWPNGAPVLMVFPGDSQTDIVFWPATQWWKVADKEGIILAIICEQYSRKSTVVSHKDNEYFVPQLLTELKKNFNIDETRIYATGQSAGSVAAQGFGMTNPEYFAAIASTSGVAHFDANEWTKLLQAATYKPMPTYAIIGEGDIETMTGTPWDSTFNQLDDWLTYYFKANGINDVGNPAMASTNGRYITAEWKNAQGFPMIRWTETLYRAHNCIPAEMPMLWDFLKHWSLKDGVRYYDGEALK